MHGRTRFATPLLALSLLLPGRGSAAPQGTVDITSGPLTAKVTLDPFSITFLQGGKTLLATAPAGTGGPGTIGFAVGAAADIHQLGYLAQAHAPLAWFSATKVNSIYRDRFDVATTDPAGRMLSVRISPRNDDGVIEVEASVANPVGVVLTGAAFARPAGERFLGFGERSDGADQTGKVVTGWTEEGPWAAGALKPATDPVFGDRWQGPEPFPGTNYPVPWFVSSRGYGFLLDTTWLNEFRAASDAPDSWSANTREPVLRYRVYAGPAPADALRLFTADTGRQPKPAPWFFGPWYQEANGHPTPDYWRRNDIPISVRQTSMHYLPCGRHLQEDQVARQEDVADTHYAGMKITAYVNSFVCAEHPDGAFAEGDSKGYFIKTQAGQTYPIGNLGDTSLYGVVDFTNPGAGSWWKTLIDDAVWDGYDGWMEDYGEYVPTDSVAHDGRTGLAFHNDYCTMYHRTADEYIRSLPGPESGGFAQFVRCGYTGTARYARLVWGGDPSEDWSGADGLAAAVSEAQSMGLSGVAYWGSDIGGFHALFQSQHVGAELLSRWLEFGAFSGMMETRASGFDRDKVLPVSTYPGPRAQVWDPAVQPTWRKYTKLRTQLFPYIWEASEEYQDTGMPLMRHPALQFPDDPGVYSPEADYEFMFGPDLLVAPVVLDGARQRSVYLPVGSRWINFWDAVEYVESTGEFRLRRGEPTSMEGGATVSVEAPLDQIPLFVRAPACLTLLPANTDTLAERTGPEAPGIMHLSDVERDLRTLAFGEICPAP